MKITRSILKRLIKEEISSAQSEPRVEFPSWLEGKIATVHGTPGSGSVFADPGSVKEKVLNAVSKNLNKIPEIANSTGVITLGGVSGIGYDLVLPKKLIDDEKDKEGSRFFGAVETTVAKKEGGGDIEVPAYRVSAPISDFSTDKLTIIVRPKKGTDGAVIPNEYIIITTWPGENIPSASAWNGQYAVIIPDQQVKNESRGSQSKVIFERWQKLAGILKG
jgi:hypothetical protein